MIRAFLLVFLIVGGDALIFNRYDCRISLDYGPNYIGIATSNFLGIVEPKLTLPNEANQTIICHTILNLACREQAKEIIIGVPLDSNGVMSQNVHNFNGQLCLTFSSILSAITSAAKLNTKIILFDERYTTKEAKIRLAKSSKKASLDAMSAACLLERYIEDEGDGAMEAEPCDYPIPRELEVFDYDIVKTYIKSTYYDDNFEDDNDAKDKQYKRNYIKNRKFGRKT